MAYPAEAWKRNFYDEGDKKMIIKRIMDAPALWNFIKNNLPLSLIAIKETDGYGGVWAIKVKVDNGFFRRLFEPQIAYVQNYSNTIVVNHPNYFSDFEDLARKYEEKYKQEVTIELHEKLNEGDVWTRKILKTFKTCPVILLFRRC